MKKILFVAALVGMSYMGMAQNAPKKASSNAVTAAPASVSATQVESATLVTETKDAAKKECSAAEKKQCGAEKKGKSCCSKKAANQ